MKILNWFKKKKEKKIENPADFSGENDKEFNKAKYKIVLLEKLGGTVREIINFEAERWVDSLDHVVYLRNEKKKFLEIFPQQIQDFKNYDETEVDSLLQTNINKLKRERKNDSDEVNDKDIEYEILKLRAKKRSFKFNKTSSYLSFDEKGKPTFYFLREGSTFFPFKWDTDTGTIFVPSDNRKKSASIALRNKEQKYNTQKIIAGVQILLLVIQIVALLGTSWAYLKVNNQSKDLFKTYDESQIAAANRACLENTNAITESVEKNAKVVESLYDKLQKELNKPQTVIQGSVLE